MAQSAENKMVNIVAQLNLDSKEPQKKQTRWLVWLVALVIIFVAAGVGMLRQEMPGAKLEEYMPYGEVVSIIEARYEGSYNSFYFYEVMAEDEICSVNTQGVVHNFVGTKVWYGNELHQGSFQIELEEPLNCVEEKTYLLFVYKGEEYLQDFYPIESEKESILKKSPYFLAEYPLIEKAENGEYILPDGGRISKGQMEEQLGQVIEDFLSQRTES